MTSLIAFRAVQGIGAGAVQPIGMTIVGDIYSVEERAKVQGYLASVWALASVVGPTLGGVFSDYLSWRWIFFVNLPIGAAALWMFVRRFEERVTKAPHRIDCPRRRCCSPAEASCCSSVCSRAGSAGPGRRRSASRCSRRQLLLLVAFVVVETRAAEPVLPLWVFRHRVILPAILTSLVVGVLLHRADVVRAPLRTGRPRAWCGHGRSRAGRAHAGLAALGLERGPALPVDRLPGDDGARVLRSGSPGRC